LQKIALTVLISTNEWLQPMAVNAAARKIGLGFWPGAEVEQGLESWIDDQLKGKFDVPGVAYFKGASTEVGVWPETLEWTLSERVKRFQDRRKETERAQKAGYDDATLAKTLNKIWRDKTVFRQDIFRFTHHAVYGADQLRQRFAFFWANHFTVGRKGDENIEYLGHYLNAAIYDALDGRFADMLYGVERHPAMQIYLDNAYNVGEGSARARECRRSGCIEGLNDNLGRELMELHTVTPSRGYTEDDIRGAAKILTGWGFPYHQRMPTRPKDYWTAYFPTRAEPGPKTVLGTTYPEGQDALRKLTDDLASDPSTAEFLSRKLATHFIGEPATEEDIAAIREAWVASDGHLPTVVHGKDGKTDRRLPCAAVRVFAGQRTAQGDDLAI